MDSASSSKKVLVCVHQRLTGNNPSCGARGGLQLVELLTEAVARQGLRIPVERFICFGMCDKGPNVRLAPGGPFFHEVGPDQVPEIVLAISRFVQGS